MIPAGAQVLGGTAQKIYRVLTETGPRAANVLAGLAKGKVDWEQAVGQLFLRGMIRSIGKGRDRKIGRR